MLDWLWQGIPLVIDFVLHIDRHLVALAAMYGPWIYAFLFLIVFCETGLVVTPFLPGDSLLFAAGALAGTGALDCASVLAVLAGAAVAGDSTNYWIGRVVGPRLFHDARHRFLNRRHLDQTHAFYARHGGKTVIIARFAPIVRTFAPFVAGIGRMHYPRFLTFSVVGTALWVGGFVGAGFGFGNLPTVREHFSLVIFAIIGLSLLPAVITAWRERRRAHHAGGAA
ncbi:MAG: DedA family protein [Deltaproteobacteria bacterium]|nr:DedA family protein [Deltaproteobacteria bacterium]